MIHCIAIDDEPLALQLIQEYCAKISFLKLEKTFTNTDEAISYMQSNKIDLLFLDIQMPDITGIQFYKNLTDKPPVIFTTAYKDFAVEGFNVDAVDYLLKPFEYDRFLKACYKAKEYIEFLSSQEVQLNSLFIKVNYEIMKVNLKDIDLMLAAARAHDAPMPLIALTRELMQAAVEAGFADEDYMAIVKLAEQQAGLSSEDIER